MNAIDQEKLNLLKQIRETAGLAFDFQRSANLLFTCNALISQRALLAYHIERGALKEEAAAIEQFKYLSEQIKRALSL